MARHEHDREDLLVEATALVERVEVSAASRGDSIILGVRRDGCLSVYLSGDEAYHFNRSSELRRAYKDGRLIKAEQGRLVSLTRHRTEGEVQLFCREYSDEEQRSLLLKLANCLRALSEASRNGSITILRCVPAELRAHERIQAWLAPLGQIVVAAEPHAR